MDIKSRTGFSLDKPSAANNNRPKQVIGQGRAWGRNLGQTDAGMSRRHGDSFLACEL